MSERVVHALVSRPGPVEAALLADLAPCCRVEPRIAGGVVLRTLASVRDAPGPTVLLLHGRGHAAPIWAPWLEAWSGRRRFVAVDLPGFGHSAHAPLPPRPTVDDALGFFVDPIEALARELGPVVLVGHSLGALVALEIVLRGRADVAALVAIGGMGFGPVVLPAARLYLHAGPERLGRLTRRLGIGAVGPSAVAGDRLGALRAELQGVRGGRPEAQRAFLRLLPLVGEPVHRLARLGEIAAPTQLVWGERDEAFPLATALVAETRIPRAELAALPAGHSPHLEQADATRARVDGFLDRRVPHADESGASRSSA